MLQLPLPVVADTRWGLFLLNVAKWLLVSLQPAR